jgi:hypothetical protein
MYMFTQKESQHTAQLLWHDWFPSVWLDEHQMGSNGRAHLRDAGDRSDQPERASADLPLERHPRPVAGRGARSGGKEGIIYNSTYTNFWQGAMAWSGWWHNQIGLLTEVASARVAAPIEQQRRRPGRPAPRPAADGGGRGGRVAGPLPPPTDITRAPSIRAVDGRPLDAPRHRRLRADRDDGAARYGRGSARERCCGRSTKSTARRSRTARRATRRRSRSGRDPARSARSAHLVEKLQMAGVEVYARDAAFEADGTQLRAGTFVVPMTQVFARYAKDMLEKQTYPEVRARRTRRRAALRRDRLVARHAARRGSRVPEVRRAGRRVVGSAPLEPHSRASLGLGAGDSRSTTRDQMPRGPSTRC